MERDHAFRQASAWVRVVAEVARWGLGEVVDFGSGSGRLRAGPKFWEAREPRAQAQSNQHQPRAFITMAVQPTRTSTNKTPLGKRKGVELAPQPVRVKRSRQDKLRAKKSNR